MQLAGEKTSGKENEMQAFIGRTLVAFLSICFLAVPVMADEILDSLNEAQEAYSKLQKIKRNKTIVSLPTLYSRKN